MSTTFVGLPAFAADPIPLALRTMGEAVTPSSTSEARASVQAEAKAMHDGGDDVGAANMLFAEGKRLKDPILCLDAADAFLQVASDNLDLRWIEGAEEMTAVALDMLYQLREYGGSAEWTPVSPEHVNDVLTRAQDQLAAHDRVRAEIEAKLAEPDEEAPPPAPDDGPKPYKPMIVAGGVMTGFGVLGLGALAGGMVMGASAQRDVEDPLVYREEHQQAERRGEIGNILVYAGAGLGAVGLGVGIALLAVGAKRKKAAGGDMREDAADDSSGATDDPTARRRPQLRVSPGLGSLTLEGRF